MKFAFFGSRRIEPYIDKIKALIATLLDGGAQVEVHSKFYGVLQSLHSLPPQCKCIKELSADTTMVVSIGGDGTFLRATHWVDSMPIPIVGLNGGHLGYLSAWRLADLDDASELARQLMDGAYDVEHREAIELVCSDMPDDVWHYALNEVSVHKDLSASMINVRAAINGYFLTDYFGDGLIIATPTGSTAYNLSVGGPIMQPQLKAWVLSPEAPHMLNMRPLVVDSSSTLQLIPTSRSGQYMVSLDGHSFSLPSGTRIELRRAGFTVAVVKQRSMTFASILREKLLWGARDRGDL